MLEDSPLVIKSCKSKKDRQLYNGQTKKNKNTNNMNNDSQNLTNKTKE
jgi:hypothetical protein